MVTVLGLALALAGRKNPPVTLMLDCALSLHQPMSGCAIIFQTRVELLIVEEAYFLGVAAYLDRPEEHNAPC
ncbi:hypothetical protein NC653_035807 [Populus alba x Populus x berolinensis]|uniref:Uncharacterized protein n=1 Tax=Populus alba x Populus x berolinensis TaxID=444605 RepID=A0AAD6LJR4_9ROSI|nr:hypothetical protein NC653_035807 [Populus alba x Populus x berolinensis]